MAPFPRQSDATKWQTGSIRGLPSLQNCELGKAAPWGSGRCAHVGVNPGNMTRRAGAQHTPEIRQCTDDRAGTSTGGNPVGCGFQFTPDGGGLIRSLSCKEKTDSCLGVQAPNNRVVIVPCSDLAAKGWAAHTA